MPFGFSLKSIVGHERDLVVEHDREVLELVLPAEADALASLRELARDVPELCPVLRELHQHDRLAGWVEVLARPRELEVDALHLGDRLLRVLRLVLEEVVVDDARDRRARAGRADHCGLRGARDDDPVLRHAHIADVLRPPSLNFALFSADGLGRERAWRSTFFDFTSKTRHSLPPPSWIDDCCACEQVVEPLVRDREAPRDRRRHEVALEVVELELRGLADQVTRAVDVGDACELHRDLVRCPAARRSARRRRACRCGSG